MTSRQRVWACTAVAVAGGLLASGQESWSAQTVFAVCALWLLCGPLLGEVAHGALAFGRLWQQAAALDDGAVERALPYARADSPIARLRLASQRSRSSPASDALSDWPLASLLWALIAAALSLLLASLFARQVELVVCVALGLALVLALVASAESAIVALLSATAWCGGLALLGRLETPQALVGLLVALLLSATTHLAPGSVWRAMQVGGGLALGAVLAWAQQPALAGLLLSALASLATPRGGAQPLALQLSVALGALLTGLAVGHWG